MKRKAIIAVALGAVLALGLSVGPAMAYFTDSTMASGGLVVNVKPDTDITEEFDSNGKHITITNSENATCAVFVRARAFASLDVTYSGSGWHQGVAANGEDPEWWYYDTELAPNSSTSTLDAKITFPADAEVGDNYNVVVVYESTPAMYNEDGSPYYDWSFILDRSES